jgi:RNA polymerase sigma-70 factor (ECF subfamily)
MASKPGEATADDAARDALGRAVAVARAAWPHVTVETEEFASYVAVRLPAGVTLADLHVDDLYLACACARGDARAFAELERCFVPPLAGPLRAIGASDDVIADVTQSLLAYLVSPGAGGAPRIAEYSGHGALRAWLRLIAVRDAGHRLRRARREVSDDDLLDALATDADPELTHLKQRYARELAAAFGAAMRSLSARDRVLLRMQLVDQLTIEQVAQLHRVHRVTAARWFATIRLSLLEVIRRTMQEQFGIEPAQLDSVLRLVRSRLHLSLARMLAD